MLSANSHELSPNSLAFSCVLNAGNATDALLYIFTALLVFTVLSGKWWIMLYLVVGVVVFCVVLLYTFYVRAWPLLINMLAPSC